MGVYIRSDVTEADTSSSSSSFTSINLQTPILTRTLHLHIIIMQSVAVFVALFALASAANVQFAVQHPGSVVTSQRLGGNFAYSVNQGGYPYVSGYGSPVVYNGVPAVQTVGTPYTYNYNTPTQYVHKTVGGVNAVPVTYGGYNTVPVSTVVAGTPASTYKTVAGVPYTSGLVGNTYGTYGGYPYGTYGGYPYGQVVY